MRGAGALANTFKSIFTGKPGTDDAAKSISGLSQAADAASRMMGDSLVAAGAQSILGFVQGAGAQTAHNLVLHSATSALMVFTQAVAAAATALGGSSSLGVLGKLFNLGTTIMGGGAILPGLTPSMIGHENFLPGIPNPVFGRASGGPLTRGQAYLINEPGTRGDVFIPGQSGWAVPNSELTSSGSQVTIDASIGYIDARGATPDAIEALRAELQQREYRLRQELPYLIDQRTLDSSKRGRF